MKKKAKLKLKILGLVTIVAVALATMSAANFFSSSLYLSGSQNYSGLVKSFAMEAYLVSTTKSQISLEAEVLASDARQTGAGGYVWQEGGYFYVIHSACEKENDANLVKQKLEKSGSECEILHVIFPAFLIEDSFTSEKQNLLLSSINSFFSSFRIVSDLAVGFDTKVYEQSAVSDKLASVKTKLEKEYKLFCNTFSKLDNLKIVALSEFLADQLECISTCEITSSGLKFKSIELLDIYLNLCEELQ